MAGRWQLARGVSSERWIAWIRVAAAAFGVLEVGIFTESFPAGYERWAWLLIAVFSAGAVAILLWTRSGPLPRLGGVAALAFDTAVIGCFGILFAYEYGSQTRWALIFVVVEAALRFGVRGGLAMPVLLVPYLVFAEWWRADRFGPPDFSADNVSFPAGIFLLTGAIVGWLVSELQDEAGGAQVRIAEAERLRDELGRRVDVLEATSRCARALGSSLVLDEAFSAFIAELRGLVPFDRAAILLVDERGARVMATAGAAADTLLPPGTALPVPGSVLVEVLEGRTVYREDMAEPEYPEEPPLVGLGLRSRVIAPLQLGVRTIGALSLVRKEPASFDPEEIELVSLLGRFVAAAVQNIRTYDAERTTVEELRRLSELRADFVSLVSHELRSPMAAVIGSARTLQQRWRELRPDQREAFLAVIGDETSRLAALIGDVLDSSRIDAGTFGYTFTDVDLAGVLREAVAAADIGQEEVRVALEAPPLLPVVRGDRERLRQLADNLISNALKYSENGGTVDVSAAAENGAIEVRVKDSGPGIALEHQRLIFEKFGRANARDAKPGTGLGLFISRSFAEAHGGSLGVESSAGEGATFVLRLPVAS